MDTSSRIKQIAITVDATGKISCTPARATIQGQNVLLAFQLQTPGYAFPSSAAVVVADAGSQFPYPCWTVDANTAVLFDANTQVGDYAYTVSVVQVDSGERLRVDPSIRNEA